MRTTGRVRRGWLGLCAAAGLASLSGSGTHAAEGTRLQIYFIDVEGGQSTLVVTPGRQTLLIDAGFAGEGGITSEAGDAPTARDPGRIRAAMRDAGVERIDYLLVTHFHRDHVGGIPELAQLVPVGTFVDYGTAYPPQQRAEQQDIDLLDVAAYDRYVAARARGRHLQPDPGDTLPLAGVVATVVSADRRALSRPLSGGGGAIAACGASPFRPGDASDENQRSLGIVLQFGRFRFLDLGDLNGPPLHELLCPVDRIGPVDVYLVAHHGNSTVADPATLAAFRPRAAIVNNAPRKGGRLPLLQMLRDASGVDGWQLHISGEGGDANAPEERIANLDESTAHWLKVTARPDGAFDVLNGRTGVSRHYGVR